MKIIVAADKNFAIGKNNGLLAKIPHDLKRFKAITLGNICIMGKNTYLSIPARPLPDRTTIVLTSTPDLFPEVECFSSLEPLLSYIKELEEQGEEIYICGGEQVYHTFLPYCEKALITHIDASFSADSWFPRLDKMPEWKKVNETEEIETGGYLIKFVDYVNNDIKRY